MDNSVEKLLYSRRDTAQALSLSVRSIDYLITTGRLTARRIGGKILVPATAVRRFATEDHPDFVRSKPAASSNKEKVTLHSSETSMDRFQPQGHGIEKRLRERRA